MTAVQFKKPIKSVPVNDMHKDRLGNEIKQGQYVALADNGMYIGKVLRFTPKMVEVEVVDRRYRSKRLKYGTDMVILEGESIFMWVLSNGG